MKRIRSGCRPHQHARSSTRHLRKRRLPRSARVDRNCWFIRKTRQRSDWQKATGWNISNQRGEVVLHVKLFDGIRRGVVIAEGIWPNSAHERGEGINVLTGADAPAPYGGAAFHDNKVWVRKAA